MAEITQGQRVRLTNPSYPDVDEVGVFLSTNLLVAATDSYGTHTILTEDGRRFRSEGVLTDAS